MNADDHIDVDQTFDAGNYRSGLARTIVFPGEQETLAQSLVIDVIVRDVTLHAGEVPPLLDPLSAAGPENLRIMAAVTEALDERGVIDKRAMDLLEALIAEMRAAPPERNYLEWDEEVATPLPDRPLDALWQEMAERVEARLETQGYSKDEETGALRMEREDALPLELGNVRETIAAAVDGAHYAEAIRPVRLALEEAATAIKHITQTTDHRQAPEVEALQDALSEQIKAGVDAPALVDTFLEKTALVERKHREGVSSPQQGRFTDRDFNKSGARQVIVP